MSLVDSSSLYLVVPCGSSRHYSLVAVIKYYPQSHQCENELSYDQLSWSEQLSAIHLVISALNTKQCIQLKDTLQNYDDSKFILNFDFKKTIHCRNVIEYFKLNHLESFFI